MAKFNITATADIGFWLVLNMMRDRSENQTPFGPFESAEAALAFHDGELAAAPYKSEGPSGIDFGRNQTFHKVFREGSQLEWMNPLDPSERIHPGHFGHGVHERITNFQIVSKTPA